MNCNPPPFATNQLFATRGFRSILFWGKLVGEADPRGPACNHTSSTLAHPTPHPRDQFTRARRIPVLARADRRKNTEYTRQWSGHGIFSRGYRSKSSQLSFGSSSTKPVLLGPPMRRARRTWCICAPAHEQKSMSACTRAIKPRTKQGIGS